MIKLTVENSWTTIEIEQYQLNQLSDILEFTYNYFIHGVVCPNEECGSIIPSVKWMKNKKVMNCWTCKKAIFIQENTKTVNKKEIIKLIKDNNKIPTGLLTRLIPKLKELNFEYQIIDKRIKILPSNYDNCIEELRYYQKEAVEIALKKCRGIIKHATGSGKTITMAYLAFNTTPPCLIIVPDLTLLNQTHDKFKKWSKSLSIGKVGEGIFDPGDITIATAQTLNSRFETEEVKELLKSINSIYLDECFAKGTKINTKNGFKNIEDIKINDLVFS